jgi:pyruvate/2-oxoglutarate dehydrogenase complex dihydrolipoamide dehydrogenase (E3) component
MDWLTREVDREGVEIKLNTEGNEENIAKENPDVVIVATGARPISPDSFSGPKVLTAWEVLGGKEVEKEALILGGGMVGMETAEFLSQKGCRVIVVEMTERLAADMEGTTRALLLERIALQKISSLLSTEVKDIRDGKVLVSHDGNERWLEAGTIILALGSRANNEILQALEGKVPQILPIGDCVEPRKAKEAIHEGFAAALQV